MVVMCYLQLLVEAKRFEEIQLHRLPVGHTHEDIGEHFHFPDRCLFSFQVDQMFSTVSRKLKGDIKTREYVQLLTPNDFDNFLRNCVFETPVKVTRIHVVPQMRSIFEGQMNPNAKGIGHIGWRPGHILTAQKRKAFERLEAENPEEWQRLVTSNSLVVSDATAQFFLEDYDVLSAMCRGHDGKNPNHVIRFVFNPITQHSTIQYKHFDFEDLWRPTMRFEPSLGQWVNDDSVTYSWFKEGVDFAGLIAAIPKVTVTPKPAESRVVDELAKCKSTMANFTPEIMAAWVEYFDLIDSIRQCATPTLPYLTPKALAEAALPTRLGMIAAQQGNSSHLYLTSVVGGRDRETLVASDQVTARAWSSSMEEMRYTPRIRRVEKEGEINQLKTHECLDKCPADIQMLGVLPPPQPLVQLSRNKRRRPEISQQHDPLPIVPTRSVSFIPGK